MNHEYLSYDSTEPKMDIQEIYDAFNNGTKNPLHFIETLCYHLNLPVDDLTFAILGDHVYTPDYNNNFFTKYPDEENLKYYQMTDYEGFQRLIEYAQKREKVQRELEEVLMNQLKGKANEEN